MLKFTFASVKIPFWYFSMVKFCRFLPFCYDHTECNSRVFAQSEIFFER